MKTDESLPQANKIAISKYLNNLLERNHRHVNFPVCAMRGLKRFGSAAITLSVIELMRRIRKGQFDITSMHLKEITSPRLNGGPSSS